MATRTQEFWAVADTIRSETGEFEIRLLNWNPKNVGGYRLLRDDPYLITIDFPDYNLQEAIAEEIKQEIKMVQAVAQNRITELTAKLNSILAIEG